MSKFKSSIKKIMLNRNQNHSWADKLDIHSNMKLKEKIARKNYILKKIADNSLMADSLFMRSKAASISEVMKTSIDRPKVTAVQDTLSGIFETCSDLKIRQKKEKKYKHWAGIKIPINSTNYVFNKNKDKLNQWDEQRDGIFYNL